MIVWNMDPVAVEAGPLVVRWYGVFFVTGFLGAYFYLRRCFRKEGKSLDLVDGLYVYLFCGTLIGARLGHCLFYEPGEYLAAPWRLLWVWEGGLASHGGVIGVFLALLLFTRRHRDVPLLWLLDRLVMPISLVAVCIRLGNLMNSEIIGRPTAVPWAFVFRRVDPLPRHPAQLYEAAAYLVVAFLLWALGKRPRFSGNPGRLTGLFFVLVFGFRFFVEFLKQE